MNAFDWFKRDDAAAPSVDEHREVLGADASNSVAAVGGVAAHQVDAARQAAEAALQSSPRRRGRPRKDASSSSGNQSLDSRANGDGNLSPELRAEIVRQMDACFDPKAWGALLACPADGALVLSGREHWKVTAEERATLGACGSAFARTLMITNPRALAGLMLGAGLFSVYIPRLTLQFKAMMDEKKKTAEKKPA